MCAEFKQYSIARIAKDCIEGEPQVSKIAVDQDVLYKDEIEYLEEMSDKSIEGKNTEDSSIKEGKVFYDIKFSAVVPDSKEPVQLFINVEAQKDDNTPYPLIKRALYYVSRMISAQKNTVFTKKHYEKIRKVYSIWIQLDVAESKRNTITKYGITEEQVIGNVPEKESNYDLISVLMLRLQRDALISKKIPFVSLPDQIYLPFLGIMLSNRFRKKKNVAIDKMMPATQCLFLYLLYHNEKDFFIKKEAAEDLGLTKTSITRASEQLKHMSLVREEYVGKEIRMIPEFRGLEFYEAAKEYLINPVQKTIHTDIIQEGLFIAGETMLSRHSMLVAPVEDTYAVFKGSDIVNCLKEIDTRWQENIKAIRVELWKYDPGLFAKDGEVDPVSLAMSLSDNIDERVEGELQSFLEEYKW